MKIIDDEQDLENNTSLPNFQIVNISQVRGNKNNPRIIKDDRYKKLVNSIKFFPEMLWKRSLVVESNEKGFTVLGGNQRLRAINEIFKMPRHELQEQIAGVNNEKTILAFYDSKQIPITLCDDWTLEQKREFIVRDNIDFGSWDMDKLSSEYELEELEDWGLEPLGTVKDEGFTEEFSLKDGDKAPFQQMTFTLANDQAVIIQNALTDIKKSEEFKYVETFGNENSNGNALYLLVSKCLM